MKTPKVIKRTENGFTLVELMIVVAIIGILASVAIPGYFNYVARSKFAAALAEVSGGKSGFDVTVNDGITPSRASDIGLQASSTNCNVTVTSSTIKCMIKGGTGDMTNASILLARDDSGWSCGYAGISNPDKIVASSCTALAEE